MHHRWLGSLFAFITLILMAAHLATLRLENLKHSRRRVE